MELYCYFVCFVFCFIFAETIKTKKAMTKEDSKEIDKQTMELYHLLLKKTGVKKSDLRRMMINTFIAGNLDCLTEQEKKKFDKLVL